MTIHYHGTPITPNAEILSIAGGHFCVSHWRPDQDRLCHEIGQSVMLDNGAFSAWKSGTAIVNWRTYYEWSDRWLDYPTTWAVIPDVITGSDDDQDELLRQWPHGSTKGAPVWHMHELVSRLLHLLEDYPRVCIGSSAQYSEIMSPEWQRRMDIAWRAICTYHRRTPNVHMLRGMQLIGGRWPFASVDSTDIGRNHQRAGNTAAKMRSRWDAGQCPPKFVCRGEQPELAA